MQEEQALDRSLFVVLLAGAAIMAVALAAIFFIYSQSAPVPKPPLLPVRTPTPGVDDSWSRIEAAGKMVVGTAADYPPFESYTDGFQIDGFDIALIREIGQRLGVEIEIRDMAFDGLGSALQLGQIDLAISAISSTPERSQAVGLSNIYFVTGDAILARGDAQVTIDKAQDLAGSRVGVQSGTVHQEWAKTQLVDTSLIAPSNLLVYREINESVNDLAQGYIDYVIVDLQPAQAAVDAGGFAIVGKDLNRQRFAIAVPNGAAALLDKLNQALGDLQALGRIEALAKQYLNLDKDDLVPVPTPDPVQPTPTPATTATPLPCLEGMQWAADLTYDDIDMTNPPSLVPGQPFVKSWRVRNIGTCAWDSSYSLVYVSGNTPAASMGGQPTFVDRPVQPGDTYDWNVNLVAPLVPGIYQALWTMSDGSGLLFGDRLSVGIEVHSPATPTPMPTQTPSPSIQFTVDRTYIKQGECVVFSWNVQNVQAAYFYADGEPWQENGVPGQGSSTVCPATTTTYNLRVAFADGTVEVRSIRIDVEAAPVDAPRITRFSVIPENQINVGQCVDIGWDVQGDVSRVALSRDGTVLWDPAPVSGNIQDCPPGPGVASYTIDATGPGGTGRSQRSVNVIQPTAPASTVTPAPPTPGPQPPVINAFSVDPNQIEPGQCVQISWRTGGGSSLVQILRNGILVLDNGPIEGAAQDCLQNTDTYTYRLIAINNAGDSAAQEASTTVVEVPPQNPLAGTVWAATFFNNGTGGVVPVLLGTNLTLSFAQDGTLNGSAGCNDYSATYTVNGSEISIKVDAVTYRFCTQPNGIMEQEEAFLATLQMAVTFAISDQDLTLLDGDGTTAVQAEKRP